MKHRLTLARAWGHFWPQASLSKHGMVWLPWLFMRIILQAVATYSCLMSRKICGRLKVTPSLYILGHGVSFDPRTILRSWLTRLCKTAQIMEFISSLHYTGNTTYLFFVQCMLVRDALPVFYVITSRPDHREFKLTNWPPSASCGQCSCTTLKVQWSRVRSSQLMKDWIHIEAGVDSYSTCRHNQRSTA